MDEAAGELGTEEDGEDDADELAGEWSGLF